jgi:hypothetical protein
MWVTRVKLFSFRPFSDATHSKCVYLNWRHKQVEVRHNVWGPSLPLTLHCGCWTWSLPTFWTSSRRSVGFSEMLNPFPADYASTHHTRNYSLKSILMYANVLRLLVGVPFFLICNGEWLISWILIFVQNIDHLKFFHTEKKDGVNIVIVIFCFIYLPFVHNTHTNIYICTYIYNIKQYKNLYILH